MRETSMERPYMIDKYLDDVIKYYELSSNKTKTAINKLLHQINTSDQPTEKQLASLKKYAFRYRMINEANKINTDSRLNKLFRKPLTSPNNDSY